MLALIISLQFVVILIGIKSATALHLYHFYAVMLNFHNITVQDITAHPIKRHVGTYSLFMTKLIIHICTFSQRCLRIYMNQEMRFPNVDRNVPSCLQFFRLLKSPMQIALKIAFDPFASLHLCFTLKCTTTKVQCQRHASWRYI